MTSSWPVASKSTQLIPSNINNKINIPFSDLCSAGSSLQFLTTDTETWYYNFFFIFMSLYSFKKDFYMKVFPLHFHITILTYLLTPWCRVRPEQLTGLQLVKKFLAFHGIRRFITALTSVRHLSLSWASRIQSIYPHPTSCRSILILYNLIYLLTYSLLDAESLLSS